MKSWPLVFCLNLLTYKMLQYAAGYFFQYASALVHFSTSGCIEYAKLWKPVVELWDFAKIYCLTSPLDIQPVTIPKRSIDMCKKKNLLSNLPLSYPESSEAISCLHYLDLFIWARLNLQCHEFALNYLVESLTNLKSSYSLLTLAAG